MTAKPKTPDRAQHEQEFIDMAAIHLMAAQWIVKDGPMAGMTSAEIALNGAEALLAERNKRITK